ncbi:ParA family protein [Sedimentitalea nanhaiensis]|uniref:Chromosome partitioning protein n=1 Tax=Sedimentitalea nanhaiensis TaxID=999627 RepID=A0A1I7DLV9_9RHOB|nr:ParA family protein [Sedimentitalea nanhaiensis]SFU12616.1 chromosome partitioning protein [Sedimentitalea nanhaiensis]
MIISLISQKGGVGKSALARLLAVEVARAGWVVKIADLDPAQGTSTKWKARRDQSGLHPEIAVEKYRTVDRAIKEAGRFDLMILDGPAHAEQGGRTMARHSDLVLMPTGYSLDDMEPQVEAAYELEEAGIATDRMFFCFCRAKGSEAEDRAARAYLTKARVNVLDPVFPELASIRQGHAEGRAASEVPFPKVQERAVAVAQAIMNHLPGMKEAA